MAAFWRVLRCNTDFASTSGEVDWAMVVTMSVMHMMQVAIHQIVHVVAVRHSFMPAIRPVYMPGFVPAALMSARAIGWILCRHCQHMFIKVPFMGMMQMPVMQIVDVPFMLNRCVPTPGPVNVRMIFVYVMFHIYSFPFVTFLPAAIGIAFSVECANALNTSPATC